MEQFWNQLDDDKPNAPCNAINYVQRYNEYANSDWLVIPQYFL